MKKLLALVLALVMTLGLATVGSNAANWSDLKDKDKVDESRQEAFQILNAIKVFEGDENNNLNPDKQLTRAEAAKIIATLNLGKTTAESLPSNGNKFSDVAASNWAAGYISYCESNGIIAGNGDGTFNPQGDLTVAAFTKMLLVSLGYNAETEKFLGADWQINTIALANRVNLFEGFETKPVATDKVNRADAAQMAFNTLKTPLVTYANYGIMGQYNNPIPSNAAQGTAVYMTTAARDTQTISTATINDGSARGTYMVEFAEQNFPKLTRNSHDVDDWGRPATTWTYDRVLVGKYVNTSIRILNETTSVGGAKVYTALGGATMLSQYANDAERVDPLFKIYTDGVDLGAQDDLDTYNSIRAKVIAGKGTLDNSGVGVQYEVFVDEDSYVDYGVNNSIAKRPVITLVAINTYLGEVLSDYADDKLLVAVYTDDAPVTFTIGKDDTDKDVSGYKEGDWVLVRATMDDDTVRVVMDPEIIKGATVTDYKATKQDNTQGDYKYIKVADGTEYKVAAETYYEQTALKNFNLRQLKDFTYNVYLDQYDNMKGLDIASRDTSLVFVAGYEKDSTVLAATTIKANMIFTDGTMATSAVSLNPKGSAYAYFNGGAANVVGTENAGKNQTLNAWFTYSKAENGAITLRDMLPNPNDVRLKNATPVEGMTQYAVMKKNANTDAEISLAASSFNYNDGNTTKKVVADDNTIFVSVSTTDAVTNTIGATTYVGAINRVNGVSVGIKNTSIRTTNLKAAKMDNGNVVKLTAFEDRLPAAANLNAAGNSVWGEDWSNIYYVYDVNGYVLAAVVVTDSVTADHVAFITSKVNVRSYSGDYYDEYDAILDGLDKMGTLKVNSTVTNTDGTKLTNGGMYAVAYDKTGETVIVATPLSSNIDEVDNANNRNYGYAEMALNDLSANTGLTVASIELGDIADSRNTNVVNGKAANGTVLGSIATKNPGNFWVLRDDTYTRYTKVSSAYNAAVATDKSTGNTYAISNVYAMCDKASGVATTMLFVAKTSAATALSNGVKVINAAGKGIYDSVKFYTEDGHTITYKEARAALLAQISDDLPGSNPVFTAYDTVKFTVNGKEVTATVTGLQGTVHGETIKNWGYQVYKLTKDGKSIYASNAEVAAEITKLFKAQGVTYNYNASAVYVINSGKTAGAYGDYDTWWTAAGMQDVTIYQKDTDVESLQALLNASVGKTVTLKTSVTAAKDLKVPANVTLKLADSVNLTVKDLTVEGSIVGDTLKNSTIKATGNATVTAGKIDMKNGTLNVTGTLTLAKGAVVTALTTAADKVEIGCKLTTDNLYANTIVLNGGDDKSEVIVNVDIAGVTPGTAAANGSVNRIAVNAKTNGTEIVASKGDGKASLTLNYNNAEIVTTIDVYGVGGVITSQNKIDVTNLNFNGNTDLDLEVGVASTITNVTVDKDKTASLKSATGTNISVTNASVDGAAGSKATLKTPTGVTPSNNTTGNTIESSAPAATQVKLVKQGVVMVGTYVTDSDAITVAFDKAVNSPVVSTSNCTANVSGTNVAITVTDPNVRTATVTVKPAASALKSGEVAANVVITITFTADKKVSGATVTVE